ncbi:hypothetical protein CCMA1212_006644 [Trichoderma ghanense]|uniref:Uncharacterized protein n=1 Tax=Trichoderma ghanense TaxID=65468 RepID=A0ABY2GYT1_9HYPO
MASRSIDAAVALVGADEKPWIGLDATNGSGEKAGKETQKNQEWCSEESCRAGTIPCALNRLLRVFASHRAESGPGACEALEIPRDLVLVGLFSWERIPGGRDGESEEEGERKGEIRDRQVVDLAACMPEERGSIGSTLRHTGMLREHVAVARLARARHEARCCLTDLSGWVMPSTGRKIGRRCGWAQGERELVRHKQSNSSVAVVTGVPRSWRERVRARDSFTAPTLGLVETLLVRAVGFWALGSGV